jgi:hypothetical protein
VVVLTMQLSAAEPSSDLNDFARQEMKTLRELTGEIDSLQQGNKFPN